MTEFWKSNPRKFCDFCKCWYADNKSSKEFHERGKRHKENVEVKIAELRKKGQKQYETNQKLDGYLKQMEEDALKAFKKDVESNPDLMPEYKVALVEHRVKQQEGDPTALQGSRYQPGPPGGTSAGMSGTTETMPSSDTQETTPSSSATPSTETQEWVKAVSPEGHTYYWNTKTAETQWEKPANFTSSKDKSSSKGKAEGKTDSDSDEDSEDEDRKEDAKSTSRGTKRTNDHAYGGWSSVSTGPEEVPDLQLPEANPLYMSSYVPQAVQYEPREKLKIQEKVVGSIKASSREAPGSASFKKRKGGQRQIRSRDTSS
eukprot:XP_782450.3 PREDICTED: WW domain-binding protein 4 isoform X1 [Strongylocentrotus purpuratus]